MTVLNQLANTNQDAALRMAQRIDDDAMRDMAYARIAGNYANSDLQKATSILDYIADPSARMSAITHIVLGLTRKDPTAARNWVTALPSGSDRDAGISQLIATNRVPPQDTEALIHSIGDKELRKNATVSYAVQLGKTDPNQARRLLDGLNLTDQERQQYERFINGDFGDAYVN